MIPINYNRERDPRRKIKIESPRSQIWAWPRLNQLNPMEAILKYSKMAYFCFFLFPLCIDISVFPSPQLTRVNSWSSLIFGRSDIRLAETPTGLWTSERPRMIIIRLNGQGGSGKNMGILAGKRIGRRGEWKYGKWKKENMFRIHYVWNWPSCCVASALYQGAL